jgi:hypothetical protein
MSSLHEDARAQAQPHRITIALQAAAGGQPQKAHAIAPPMLDLGRHGLTNCGFPVEQLRIMPNLEWTDVDDAERCEHCADPSPGNW